ncbi:cadherin repeat domain-containing protein [Octadecabacter sp. G9-8]|uniref:Cadherin repeat domain-containing protein n=1 Tax=Octadecabacter dasysiphoniae TaxID=2909341 RepID=A0ABS9CX98_9RHOB|nr:cadherin repeat domain-containing protein [Octadecabacter dasysiphoniae]MCF2871870.1 cadherin repeat domain-containing protein [Octadecabacter dasysiphoniae]
MTNRFKAISPLALLGLAACKSSDGGSVLTSSGFAIKGPLVNALAFVDENDNRVLDSDEAFVRTGSDGGFSLANPNGANIVIQTDDQTIDSASGEILDGVTLVGAADATVITPFTTLSVEDVDTTALAAALGLPDDVDLLTFNPFAEDADAATALAVEKLSQQLIGTLQILEAAGDETAFESILSVVSDALEGGDTDIDFTDSTFLAEVVAASGLEGADAAGVAGQILAVNEKIDDVKSLDAPASAFGLASGVAGIYEEEGVAGGNEADVDNILAEAENEAPTDLTVTSEAGTALSIDETATGGTDVVVGLLTATDGANDTLTFEVTGDAAHLFEVSTSVAGIDGPVLVAKAGAVFDAETTASVDVTLKVTDQFGETADATVTVNIANIADEDTQGGDDVFVEGSIHYGGSVTFQSTLTDADNGTDTGDFASETYTWYLDGEAIEGETGQTIQTTQAMTGKFLSAELTVVDQAGGSTSFEDGFGHILPRYFEGDTPIVITVNENTADGLEAFADNIAVLEDDIDIWGESAAGLFNLFEVNMSNSNAVEAFLTSSGKLGFEFQLDDGEGDIDTLAQLEFRLGDLDTQTFDSLTTLVGAFNASEDLVVDVEAIFDNPLLSGALEDIIFETEVGALQLALREGDTDDDQDAFDIRLNYYDEETGEDVLDPDFLQTLSIRGDYGFGLADLYGLVTDLAVAVEESDEAQDAFPEFGDYYVDGIFDEAAYEDALDDYDNAVNLADFNIFTTLVDTLSPEGLRANYFDNGSDGDNDDRFVEAFYLNFFNTDDDGSEGIYFSVGDYAIYAEGDFPGSLGEILSGVEPFVGDINGGDPSASDLGFEALDYIAVFEQSEDENGNRETTNFFSVDIADNVDLLAVLDAITTDDGEAFGSYPNVGENEDTPDDERYDLSYAYDEDGLYIVLGEGLDLDAFDVLLDELSLTDLVAA